MAPNTTFESLNFNPFIANDSLNDNSQDPDVNFFHDNVSPLDTDYISPDDFSGNFKDFTENSFSVLHLNIRSLNKNFESFAELYKSLSFKFSIICFSETWSNDENLDKNSLFQLEGYSLLHENRKYRRGGGVAIFVHESLCYTKRNDLCINCEAIESLSIEIRNNDGKNIIFNIVYRPPDGDLEVCENYFQSILSHNSIRNKNVILAGDFNINVLDFEQNKKVQNFVNLMFQFGLVPTINKPTRVTNKTISAIDHIVTNSIYNNDFKTAIKRTDISDHFPITCAFKLRGSMSLKNHQKK